MKNRHKYFRNKRYKEKLEHKYFSMSPDCGIEYITKVPITNIPTELDWRGNERDASWYRSKNQERYEYYYTVISAKPDVPYTILKVNYRNRASFRVWLKKHLNRQFRRNNKDWMSSERRSYQKLYEYWWDIY